MADPTPVKGLTAATPATRAARKILSARLKDVQRNLARAARLDPRGIHDMRVAARRLRAAMKHLGGASPQVRRLSARVKALQDALGVIRERQVDELWLAGWQKELKPRPGVRLRPSTLGGRRALQRALDRWSNRTLPEMEQWIAALELEGVLGAPERREAFLLRRARLAKQASRIDRPSQQKKVHRLRIAAKKLRYEAELLQFSWPDQAPVIASLSTLQSALGELHDAQLRVERLKHRARGAKGAERRALRRLAEAAKRERGAAGEVASRALKTAQAGD